MKKDQYKKEKEDREKKEEEAKLAKIREKEVRNLVKSPFLIFKGRRKKRLRRKEKSQRRSKKGEFLFSIYLISPPF